MVYNKNMESKRGIKTLVGIIAYSIVFCARFLPDYFRSIELSEKDFRLIQFTNGAFIALSIIILVQILSIENIGTLLLIAVYSLALSIPLLSISMAITFFANINIKKPYIPYFVNTLLNLGSFASMISLICVFMHISFVSAILFILSVVFGILAFITFLVQFVTSNKEAETLFLQQVKKYKPNDFIKAKTHFDEMKKAIIRFKKLLKKEKLKKK